MPTVRILAIDGGGIRGILPARVLQAIETATKLPAKKLFHMIAGTSTGGIISCGLSVGRSAEDLGNLYAQKGGQIFAHSLWRKIKTFDNLGGPEYAPDTLETILHDELGETWLSETDGAELVIPSYCIQLPHPVPIDGLRVQSTRNPYLFKSWKVRPTGLRDGDDGDGSKLDFKLKDIARATSAAPTYFPPAKILNKAGDPYWMVDGGVFANNPAMCALTSARHIYPDATQFLVISLGTGSLERQIDGDEAAGWGELHWLHPILSILMDGNADTVCYQLDQLPDVVHKRFEISLGTDPNDKYTVNEDFDNASTDNITRLENLAGKLIRDDGGKLDEICALLRQPKDDMPLGLPGKISGVS